MEADLAQSVIDSLPSDTADEFSAEIERIAAMVDDLGQQALLAMREWRQRILEIEGSYARAHWLYLLSPDAFRQAEEIRLADENQDAPSGTIEVMGKQKATRQQVASFSPKRSSRQKYRASGCRREGSI